MMLKRERPRIKDCLPLVNGLWNSIDYDFPEQFDLVSSQLDVIFLSNWSQRYAAPILEVIHDDSSGTPMLTNQELGSLADIIKGMYKHKWDKLMAVAVAEYDPIHNYADILTETIEYSEEGESSKTANGTNANTRTDDLTETATDGRQVQETKNLTNTETDARQIQDTKNLTETQTDLRGALETRNLANSASNSSADGIYGFNSSTAVGDTNTSGNNSGTETGTIGTQNSGTLTTENTGTDTQVHSGNVTTTDTGTDTTVHSGNLTTVNTGTQQNYGSVSSSESADDEKTGTRSREYTKTGNIGNISTQKLLKEEIDLWKYNFICEIMRDVANFVSLPIYEQ